jgi:hypothetical protein
MDTPGRSDDLGDPADSERIQAADASAGSGQAADAAAEGTRVYSGDLADAVWKPFRKWCFAAVGTLAVAFGVGVATGRSAEQLTFITVGISALYGAAFVWLTGVGGFSYENYGGVRRLEVHDLRWPRGAVLLGLILPGVLLLLAALPGRFGASAAATDRTGFVLWDFAKGVSEWLTLIVIVGFCIVGLRKKEERRTAGCLLGLLAAVYGVVFLPHLFVPAYEPIWDEGTGPLRDVWDWLHGEG